MIYKITNKYNSIVGAGLDYTGIIGFRQVDKNGRFETSYINIVFQYREILEHKYSDRPFAVIEG